MEEERNTQGAAGQEAPEGKKKARLPLPVWALAGLGALLLLGLLLALLLGGGKEKPAEGSPVTEPAMAAELPEGQLILTLSAENWTEVLEPGDLIRVLAQYANTEGQHWWDTVRSLQYVKVAAVTDTSISVYMTADQMWDYLAVQDRCTVALAARGGGRSARELLDWQAHFNAPTVTLELAEASKTVAKGGKVQLKLAVSVDPEEADPGSVTWASSDETIATVDADGMVSALEAGTVQISASCGDAVTVCTVTVYPVATEISIEETAVCGVGGTVQLTAALKPDGLADPITWSSSDEAVAAVAEDGTVTGVAVGEADITAVCGDVSAVCHVYVRILAEEIHLTPESLALKPGQTAKLQAQVGPDNTTDPTVVWSSSDEAVATVAADGTVTGVAAGEAEITAACGNVTATCTVTVQ